MTSPTKRIDRDRIKTRVLVTAISPKTVHIINRNVLVHRRLLSLGGFEKCLTIK